MRRPNFRGKSVKDGKWVEGDLFLYPVNGEFPMRDCIVEHSPDLWTPLEVDPTTISRSTGLQDKNGTTVYEGDFLSIVGEGEYEGYTSIALVRWGIYRDCGSEDNALGFYCIDEETNMGGTMLAQDEIALTCGTVIGNKWDNPEIKEAYS